MKLLIILTLLLTGCATHSVTIGPMEVWGSNEQSIPEPRKE
mgnify:CR=1 FL=1